MRLQIVNSQTEQQWIQRKKTDKIKDSAREMDYLNIIWEMGKNESNI